MIYKIILIIMISFGLKSYAFSEEANCAEFKKFSINYMKCKTLSAGKNFINDTKNYQKKEWSNEKEKMDKLKKKVFD